jgi:hypothetical protein
LSVVCLVLKSPHTQNSLLRLEWTGVFTHHKHMKVTYYYIENESWRLQSKKIITFVI